MIFLEEQPLLSSSIIVEKKTPSRQHHQAQKQQLQATQYSSPHPETSFSSVDSNTNTDEENMKNQRNENSTNDFYIRHHVSNKEI